MLSACCGWMIATSGPALSERKRLLRKLLPLRSRAALYLDHFASRTDLFRVICDRDMQGVVAKQASASYTPEATTWVKIKNRHHGQAIFKRPKTRRSNLHGFRHLIGGTPCQIRGAHSSPR